jgi:hypothetical protein
MADTRLGVLGKAPRVLRWLIRASKPASRAFILEIVAALLSVLALRHGVLGGPVSKRSPRRKARDTT